MFNVGAKRPGFSAGAQGGNLPNLAYLIAFCGLLTYADGIDTGTMYDLTENEYNWTNDGTTLTIAAIYPTLVTADTENIIYDAIGDPKPLLIADLPNIKSNQFYFDEVNDKVMFFSTQLPEPCYTKANKFFDFVEQVFDSEGLPIFTTETWGWDRLYVLNEGVIREE